MDAGFFTTDEFIPQMISERQIVSAAVEKPKQ
jgi:hypothetical protein